MNLELEVGGVIAKLQVLGLPSGQLCPPCCSPLLTLNPSPMDPCHLFGNCTAFKASTCLSHVY